MSANPIASDLRAVPDASTPLVPEPQKDHRWWSNDEQREYLASQQRDYLKSKTVTGGATLFFRKIDTEFMSRWDPKSLVAQFNIEPRGAFWNPDCPSLFQDFATATRNHVPEQGAEKHLAGDSTITRIRKRLRWFFNNHNKSKRMVGVSSALKGFKEETKRQRAHTGKELYSKDFYSTFKEQYEPIAMLALRKAQLIKSLEESEIDTSSVFDADSNPASDEDTVASLDFLAFSHGLEVPEVPAIRLRNTTIQLAFARLPLTEQKRYHDAADAQKAVTAAAKKKEKKEKKQMKQNPEAPAEPIPNDILQHYLKILPALTHNFLQSVVLKTGHTCFLVTAGPDGDGHLVSDFVCHGPTNPNGESFMDAYPNFKTHMEKPFREYARTCFDPSQVKSRYDGAAQSSTASAPSTSSAPSTASTSTSSPPEMVYQAPAVVVSPPLPTIPYETTQPVTVGLATLERNSLFPPILSPAPTPSTPPSNINFTYDNSDRLDVPASEDFLISGLDDSQRSGLFKSLCQNDELWSDFGLTSAQPAFDPTTFYAPPLGHRHQSPPLYGAQSALIMSPQQSFSSSAQPLPLPNVRPIPSYGSQPSFVQPFPSSQTVPAYSTTPGAAPPSQSMNGYPAEVYQQLLDYGLPYSSQNLQNTYARLFGTRSQHPAGLTVHPSLHSSLSPSPSTLPPEPAHPNPRPHALPVWEFNGSRSPFALDERHNGTAPTREVTPELEATSKVRKPKRKKQKTAPQKPQEASPSKKKTRVEPPPQASQELTRRPTRRPVVAAHQAVLSALLVHLLEGMRTVQMGETADLWDRLIQELKALEIKIASEDPNYTRQLVPFPGRPALLVQWMSAGCDFNQYIAFTPDNLTDYVKQWGAWWEAVQPAGRKRGALVDGHALSDLRCGGEEGLVTLMLGLFHWGRLGKDLAAWNENFADFNACVLALALV